MLYSSSLNDNRIAHERGTMKKRTAFSFFSIAASLVIMVFSFFPSGKVLAAGTTLTINSNPAGVTPGGTTTIYVDINDVTDLWAYYIKLSYDPTKIQVVSVSNSGFLTPWYVDGPNIDNTNGILTLSVGQTRPSLPKSGSGHLITIVIQGVALGQSQIDFAPIGGTVHLSDRNGIEIPSTTVNGIVYVYSPTAVTLDSFTGAATRKSIVLDWKTTDEQNNLGFNVYRSTSANGPKIKLNQTLILTNVPPGTNFGAEYQFIDGSKDLKNKATYYYWLEAVDLHGKSRYYGPVSVLFWQSTAR